jgi:hypothetical protein
MILWTSEYVPSSIQTCGSQYCYDWGQYCYDWGNTLCQGQSCFVLQFVHTVWQPLSRHSVTTTCQPSVMNQGLVTDLSLEKHWVSAPWSVLFGFQMFLERDRGIILLITLKNKLPFKFDVVFTKFHASESVFCFVLRKLHLSLFLFCLEKVAFSAFTNTELLLEHLFIFSCF